MVSEGLSLEARTYNNIIASVLQGRRGNEHLLNANSVPGALYLSSALHFRIV